MMNEQIQAYLNQYLNTLSPTARQNIPSTSTDYFCADEENANICAELVRTGKKTATCSLEHWYSSEKEPMPQVGNLQVVTNWQGEPVCIIETTKVSTTPFNEVTTEFAKAEGEGDLSLTWWREAHWQFFSAECQQLQIEPSEFMLLVLERFNVVYPISNG